MTGRDLAALVTDRRVDLAVSRRTIEALPGTDRVP
jgi:hypothetical protein